MGPGVTKTFSSTRLRQASALWIGIEAVRALLQGKTRLGAVLLGAAVLAYRFTVVGLLAQVFLRLNRRRREDV